MTRSPTLPWTALIAPALVVLGLVLGFVAQWYGMKQDIHDLQEFNRYQYGVVSAPKER